MIILLVLSIMSWTMIFKRTRDLSQTEKRLNLFEDRFWSGIDLSKLYVDLNSQPSANVGEESLFRAGFKEFTRLRQLDSTDRTSAVEGIERAMRVAYMRERDRLENHLPFLATVGSTSPYLGLFGTVWGIMNSFLALAQAKQATLTVVAPAIAEALIATAMGLAAAIPAV
ncbi:MAG: protein TolQ, partial [Pseudomonadota bacterium]